MIRYTRDGVYLYCNKCSRIIKVAKMYSPSLIDKYEKKKIYCGRCIQERIHRNDPEWEYEKEFSYK
jgi:hypothetical protein